jgi:hypothetical protein
MPDIVQSNRVFLLKSGEINGIQMGILSNGIPYLSLRSLARLCGVDNMQISRMSDEWAENTDSPRNIKLKELLSEVNYHESNLFTRVETSDGEVYAYTEHVCLSILDYYAHEAGRYCNDIAKKNLRFLNHLSFRIFVYKSLDYDPNRPMISGYEAYIQRVTINEKVRSGYFTVFMESSVLTWKMISAGLEVNEKTIVDGSIGLCWGNYWRKNNLEEKYGERIPHIHVWPMTYPQAVNGPINTWAYPDTVLVEFRRWMYNDYVKYHLPKYLKSKVKGGEIEEEESVIILDTLYQKDQQLLQ